MKHTPGPWKVSLPDDDYYGVIRVWCHAKDSSDTIPVAICPQEHSASINMLTGEDLETNETAANARLIAAAPDGLEANLAVIAYDEAIQQCGNNPEKMASFCTARGDNLDILYSRMIDKARAAIAKAKGNLVS